MSSSPLISVVVVNYNYGRFLPEALGSVLAQTYQRVEVVVVDDGSTDESQEVLREYDGRVRLIYQPNRGVSAARNRGITESRGELVAFLDADDVWTPEKLERQVALFRDPQVGMVYSGIRYVDEEGQSLGTNLNGCRGRVLVHLALLRDPGVLAAGSSSVVRRRCLGQVGLFDESLSTSADWDMCRRIACRYDIAMVPEPLVLYRQHAGAMHRNVGLFERDMMHAFESMFADDAAHEVHLLKRRCYGNLHLTLAGSYFHAGELGKSLGHLWSSLTNWPPGISYVLATPVRRIARRFGAGVSLDTAGRLPH